MNSVHTSQMAVCEVDEVADFDDIGQVEEDIDCTSF
jgi:hypothetical protein